MRLRIPELVVLGVSPITAVLFVDWLRKDYYLSFIQAAAIGFFVGVGLMGLLYVGEWVFDVRYRGRNKE